MKSVIAIVALLFIGNMAYSQHDGKANTRNYSKEAERLWLAGAYSEAAEAYKLASEKINPKNKKAKDKKAHFAYMSATCYRLLRNFPAAEQQYEKAVLLGYDALEPMVHFYLAEMEMAQCKHNEAKQDYEEYDKLNPGDPITQIRIESCNKYAEFSKNTTRHLVSNVTKLNTETFDYAPVVGPRGTEMYFSSSRQGSTGETTDPITGESYMDIWISQIDRKGNWGQPSVVEGINTGDNEGTLAFDARGKTMFFTRCPVEDKMRLGCDIYISEKKGKGWGEPEKITLKDHDSTHVGHPCISPDGKTLIFSSNMAGGYGGVDLWMSTFNRREDTWSLPVNLGPEINTVGNDVFPTWGPNNELYYATDGLVGLGGLDLYMAPRVGEENKWSNPTNLMAPINSCRDDYHIFFTESGKIQRGFFSSNRNGSKGEHSQDIWDFYLPPVLVDVLVMVHDQETGEPIPNMPVTLVGSDGSNYTLTTDASGQINLGEKPDGERYVEPGATWDLVAEGMEGEYLDAEDNFTTVGITSPTRIIRDLKVLNIAKPIRLPEVRYDLGSSVLQVIEGEINSKDSLNYLYNLMIEHPNLVVELGSHTDSRGSASANQKLSQARAQSCIDYLVAEKGLPADRFVPKGYGENIQAMWYEIDPTTKDTISTHKLTEKFINSFKSSDKPKFDMLHQLNRRTECKILSMDYVAKEPEVVPGDGTEGGDGN